MDYDIENSGIGNYEFWGFFGFDMGKDSARIWDFVIKSNYEESEKDEIISLCNKNKEQWEEELLNRSKEY